MPVSSVPLSLTIVFGRPRRTMMAVSSRVTRNPENEVSVTSARHSRLKSSTIVSTRNRRPSGKESERLGEAGIEPSVGSVGDSYGNALTETINRLFKAEVIHRRGPWRNFETVEYATLEWVDWLNNRRLLEPTGIIPPAETEAEAEAEAEANFYPAVESDEMAA